MAQMFDKKHSDLRRMEGKKFGIDQAMTILCFVLLIIVVVAPVGMIIYNAVWDKDSGSIDFSMFGQVLFAARVKVSARG